MDIQQLNEIADGFDTYNGVKVLSNGNINELLYRAQNAFNQSTEHGFKVDSHNIDENSGVSKYSLDSNQNLMVVTIRASDGLIAVDTSKLREYIAAL